MNALAPFRTNLRWKTPPVPSGQPFAHRPGEEGDGRVSFGVRLRSRVVSRDAGGWG